MAHHSLKGGRIIRLLRVDRDPARPEMHFVLCCWTAA
jgi:hypothetical protein